MKKLSMRFKNLCINWQNQIDDSWTYFAKNQTKWYFEVSQMCNNQEIKLHSKFDEYKDLKISFPNSSNL